MCSGYHRSRDGNSSMHTHQSNEVNRRSRSHTCHQSTQVKSTSGGGLYHGTLHEFTARPSSSHIVAATGSRPRFVCCCDIFLLEIFHKPNPQFIYSTRLQKLKKGNNDIFATQMCFRVYFFSGEFIY